MQEVQKSLIEEFWYPKFGPGQLWETLADKIEKQGGKILKNYKVEKLNVEDKIVKSVLCKINNQIEEIKADIFISSMPIKDLIQGMRKDLVPDKILKIANRITIQRFYNCRTISKKINLNIDSGNINIDFIQ